MPDPSLMRAHLNALWPKGSAWRPKPGGQLDDLLKGIGDNWQAMHDFLATLAYIRDPYTTPILDDLEREYGIAPDPSIPTAMRRNILAARKFNKGWGTPSDLQAALNVAGFGVGGYSLTVYANDPAVNPATWINLLYQTQCNTSFGVSNTCNTATPFAAFCGIYGNGILVTNGDQITVTPQWSTICNATPTAVCRAYLTLTNTCGSYFKVNVTTNNFATPPDFWTWSMVFFVAGGVTTETAWYLNHVDPLEFAQAFTGQSTTSAIWALSHSDPLPFAMGGSGQINAGGITALQFVSIPTNLLPALKRIILGIKPLHTWCVLAVTPS